MSDMEQKYQNTCEDFDSRVESVDSFISDLILICKKHKINNDDLNFVNGLFQCEYMPKLETNNDKQSS